MKNVSYETLTCAICGEEHTMWHGKFKKHVEECHQMLFEDYLRQYTTKYGTGYCVVCGNPTKITQLTKGFQKYCCKECEIKDTPSRMEKYKQTCMEKYGVPNLLMTEEAIQKAKETCIRKYGVDNVLKSPEMRQKIKETCLERYGVDNPSKTKEIQEKYKETCREKYGVDNVFQLQEIKDKISNSYQERYGVDWGTQVPEIKEKINHSHKLKLYDTVIKTLESTPYTLLSSKEEYATSSHHRFWCKIHNIEFESWYDGDAILCPECKKERGSGAETEVKTYIESLGFHPIYNTRQELDNHKELDLYIPEKKIAIEYDGLYYHSAQFGKSKEYHLNKTKECEAKGIQLIHIFENEWIGKQEIVKSILAAKLGKIRTKYMARKCEIRPVLSKEYRTFLDENHIQGYCQAGEKFGLYFQGELVCLASFVQSRFKRNEWELARFCNKKFSTTVGGMTKLLAYWHNLHPGEDLYSYCDRRYSNGAGYYASGWELVGTTNVNYLYFRKNSSKLENRMKYQKKNLKKLFPECDLSMTEHEIMEANGFRWIWDCGTLKMRHVPHK